MKTTVSSTLIPCAPYCETNPDLAERFPWKSARKSDRAAITLPKIQRLALAKDSDREPIFKIRHAVYARELGQHEENTAGRLSDSLDQLNHYLCLWEKDALLGFISITPPTAGIYSIDKHLSREDLPFECDDQLYEIRLLTVLEGSRGRQTAGLLMYAALRWVESHRGTRIMAIGRQEILSLYQKAGLRRTGRRIQSGRVTYELMHASVRELSSEALKQRQLLERFHGITDWQLNIPFYPSPICFHGGRFFQAIGERFEALERADEIINADVLDAWFPPAPEVIAALMARLPWLLRTSPPTTAAGFIEAIAQTRGISSVNILPGSGSSDLIFRAMSYWLSPASKVLILDPSYGEYSHVLERVIGCRADRLELQESENFRVDPCELQQALSKTYDLAVVVNPNSPTGQHISRESLEKVLRIAPRRTRIWIDETYIEYIGSHESMESFAASSENVIVCKSLSKVYALSGARAAYLCGPRHQLEPLVGITPPWVVSLPGQVATVMALQHLDYYQARYEETHRLREQLSHELTRLGFKVFPGSANFLLARLPKACPGASRLTRDCECHDLFIRDASNMSRHFGDRFIRIAVKDAATNGKMIDILRAVLKNIAVAPNNRSI